MMLRRKKKKKTHKTSPPLPALALHQKQQQQPQQQKQQDLSPPSNHHRHSHRHSHLHLHRPQPLPPSLSSTSTSTTPPTKKKKLLQAILNNNPNLASDPPPNPNPNPNPSLCLSPSRCSPNPSHIPVPSPRPNPNPNPNPNPRPSPNLCNPNSSSPNPKSLPHNRNQKPRPHPKPNSPFPSDSSLSSSSSSSSSSCSDSSAPAPPNPLAHLRPHHSHASHQHQQQLLLQQQKQEALHQQTQKLTSELRRKLQQQHLHHLQLQQHHPELLQHLKTHVNPHQNTDLRQQEQGLGSANPNYLRSPSPSPSSNPNPSHNPSPSPSPNPSPNPNPNPNPKRTRAVFEDQDLPANGADKMEPLLKQGKSPRNPAMETPPSKTSETSETPVVPTKQALGGILEELQKKDKIGAFSEPVDPKEVPEYHNIIKEPMDFGTMKKRIAVGYYTDLGLFEKDIFKICSNAMTFNAMGTVYYKQARAIKVAAERCFGDLRTKFSSAVNPAAEVVTTQKSSVKRSHKKKAALNVFIDNPNAPEAVLNNGDYDMVSQADHALVQEKVNGDFQKEDPSMSYLGKSGEGRRSLPTDESRRNTFKPRPVRDAALATAPLLTPSLQFVPAACQFQFSYARSLAWFAGDLGPDVWKVAQDKIRRALPQGVPFGPGWVGERGASGASPIKPNITVHSKQRDPFGQTKLPHLQNDRLVRNGPVGGDSRAKEMVHPEVSASHADGSHSAGSDCLLQPKDSASELHQAAKDARSSGTMTRERKDDSCLSNTAGNNVLTTTTSGLQLCSDVNTEQLISSSRIEAKAAVVDLLPQSSGTAPEGRIQEKPATGEAIKPSSFMKSNYSEPLQNGQAGGRAYS